MGAKKLYTDTQLLDVVDKYFSKYNVVDTVSPETIAKFATEELGMLSKNGTPLNAKLFRRNEKVMNLLKTYNEDTFIPDSVNEVKNVQFLGVNIPKFVKTYRNNPKMMTAMLTHHQKAHRALMDEQLALQKQFDELKEKYDKLVEKFKNIKGENEKLIIQNKNICNFKNFQRDMEMLNYLVEKGYIDSVSDSNIELAGKRTGVISVEPSNKINLGKPQLLINDTIAKQINETEEDDKNISNTISLDEVKASKAKSFWDNI